MVDIDREEAAASVVDQLTRTVDGAGRIIAKLEAEATAATRRLINEASGYELGTYDDAIHEGQPFTLPGAVDAAIEHGRAGRQVAAGLHETVTALRAEVARLRPEADRGRMYQGAYLAASEELDRALGTEEEDGAGEGLAADVALLAAQRDAYLAVVDAARAAAGLLEVGDCDSEQCPGAGEPTTKATCTECAALNLLSTALRALPPEGGDTDEG